MRIGKPTTPFIDAVFFALVISTPVIAQAAGVVGTGTPDSCTETALNAALAGGGLVTFNCGPQPVTITLTHQKDISYDTTVDGGGLVTLDGHHAVGAFTVTQGQALSVENLTIVNGYGIYNNGGTLTITDSTFSGNDGAIYNAGTLTVINSTFASNSRGSALCVGLGGAVPGGTAAPSTTAARSR